VRKNSVTRSTSRSSQKPSLRWEGCSRLSYRLSLRRDRDRGPGRFCERSHRRALLAWARPPLAQRWGSSPGLKLEQHTKAPTRSRLSEHLSPKRDSTSLKKRALRLSEGSSVNLACFCKSCLGEAGPLGREYQTSPLFSLQQLYFHTQTVIPDSSHFHNSTQAIKSWNSGNASTNLSRQ